MPNLYSSYAVLLVGQESGNVGLSALLSSYGVPVSGGTDLNDNVSLILTVLESRQFLDILADEFDIVERYGIQDHKKVEARNLLRNSMDYTYRSSSNTLVLSFTGSDRYFATEFVNKQIDLLEEWYKTYGGNQSRDEIDILEVQLTNQENRIAALETSIKAIQKEHNALSIEDLAAQQSSMIGELRAQKVQVELQIQTAQQFSQGQLENESLINLRLQRDNLEYMISQLERGYSGREKIMPSIDELPDLAIKYSKLQQELLLQNTIYSRLKEQLELAKLNKDRGQLFTVLERAEVPEYKVSPRRSVICAVSAIAAFFASCIIALVVEKRKSIMVYIRGKIADAQN